MKLNVVFRINSLKMGGVEKVLTNILKNMDELDKYNLFLLVKCDYGKENILLDEVPSRVKVEFLNSKNLSDKIEKYYLLGRGNFFYRIIYLFFKYKGWINICKKMKKITKKIGNTATFIDYAGPFEYIFSPELKNSVVWIHGNVSHSLKFNKYKIRLYKIFISKYKKIVVICDEMKEEVIKLYPLLANKIEMAYNPFDFEKIKKLADDDSELTYEQKKMLKEKYCIAVSRLDDTSKDYPTLLKAFQILKNEGLKKKLYIIGDGPAKREIKLQINKLGLEDIVVLVGLQKNPYIWMKNAELFVHSSKHEGLPTVLIEAMICGNVVISSNCPTGPKEILNNGELGKLIPVGDHKKFAEGIREYFSNSEKEYYLKKIEKKIKIFDKKVIMKKYEQIIENF